MGRAEGIEIEEIVLHPFGGLARLRNEPESPRAEFRIAIATAASFYLAESAFLLFRQCKQASPRWRSALLSGAGNLLLAVFNLFRLPLDGGRVLRDPLAQTGRHHGSHLNVAGICGMLIAAILIIFGVYMAIAPNFRAYFMGFWSVLVGLFFSTPPTASNKHTRNKSACGARGDPHRFPSNRMYSSAM